MRDLILMTITTRRPGAIFIALAGQMSSPAYVADVITSRAHCTLAASRTQDVLA